MNVIGIVKTVASVLLYLPQFDKLIAFLRAEQEVAIVLLICRLRRHMWLPGTPDKMLTDRRAPD